MVDGQVSQFSELKTLLPLYIGKYEILNFYIGKYKILNFMAFV